MSEQPKSSRRSSEHRGSGNIWFVLIVIAGAVLVSAFLVSDTQKRLPYPHLIQLLSQTAALSERSR